MSSNTIPPPPPPPLNPVTRPPAPTPPAVPAQGPPRALLVELWIYEGGRFKDHWAYRVRSSTNERIGVVIHATGDVRNGFELEFKRSHDLSQTSRRPRSIPLQWVDGSYFDEPAMLNHGQYKEDDEPVCPFEASAAKTPAPAKSLNDSTDSSTAGKKVTQRNCQTWIVESADQLAKDGIFSQEVAAYLVAAEQ